MTETRQLTTAQKSAKNIRDFLVAKKGTFDKLLPEYLTPERMLSGVMAVAARNPRILECTTESILNVVIVASTLGLEIGNPRGGMHIVPFKNGRTGKYEATGIPDYRGLMILAYRSGQVLSIRAAAVYDNDDFDYAEGTQPFIKHVPSLDGKKGKLKCVYAVAELRDLGPQFKVVPLWECDEHRDRSRAKSDGPWKTDYVAMCLKTAVKMLCNWLPAAPLKLVQAVEYEDRVDRGEGISDLFENVIEMEPDPADNGQSRKAIDELNARSVAGQSSPDASTPRGEGPDKEPLPAPDPPSITAGGAPPHETEQFVLPRKMHAEEGAHHLVHQIRNAFETAAKDGNADPYWDDSGRTAAGGVTDDRERTVVLAIASHYLRRKIKAAEVWVDTRG